MQISCLMQQMADLSYQVQWSRQLLSSHRDILGADLLFSAWTVEFDPHFQRFFSPDVLDSELGCQILGTSVESLWRVVGFTSRSIFSLRGYGFAIFLLLSVSSSFPGPLKACRSAWPSLLYSDLGCWQQRQYDFLSFPLIQTRAF